MLNPQIMLADASNRAFIMECSQNIVSQLSPEELIIFNETASKMLDAIQNSTISTDNLKSGKKVEMPLAFLGGAELLTLVAVPIVVAVLSNILSEIGKETIKSWKERKKGADAKKVLFEMTVDERKKVILATIEIPGNKKKADQIAQIIAEIIPRMLDSVM